MSLGAPRRAAYARAVVTVSSETTPAARSERVLDAVLALLSRGGISAVTMRAVASEAGVALGTVGYHYGDKNGLVRAALLRIESEDLAILEPRQGVEPEAQLRKILRSIAAPRLLTTEYLSLRLQLWSLAQAHPDFEAINAEAQKRYRSGLARLIRAARSELSAAECNRRAADIDVLQNGIWLTSLLGLSRADVQRSLRRCEEIALGE